MFNTYVINFWLRNNNSWKRTLWIFFFRINVYNVLLQNSVIFIYIRNRYNNEISKVNKEIYEGGAYYMQNQFEETK